MDSENVVAGYDWLPSNRSLAGVKAVPDDLDGEDVSDIWPGANRKRQGPLFGKAGGNHAMREGKWKFYLPWDGKGELYDMLADQAEANNVANKYPEVASDLKKKVESTGKYKHQY